MILVKEEIRSLNLIDYGFSEKCIRPTSYNLRLGSEYLLINDDENDNSQIKTQFCKDNGFLTIPAFGSAIISTYEKITLPNDIAGRFDLKIKHALEGIIVQRGLQVEPGYDGQLFALVHNISSKEKTFKYKNDKESIFAIEFHQITHAVENNDKAKSIGTLAELLPSYVIRGGLHSMIVQYKRSEKALIDSTNELRTAHASISQVTAQIETSRSNYTNGFFLVIVALIMSIALPMSIAKLTYDKDDIPFTTAKAITDSSSANIDYDYLAYQIEHRIADKNINNLDKKELSTLIKQIIHDEINKSNIQKPNLKDNNNNGK